MFIERRLAGFLFAMALGLAACGHPGKDLPVGTYERGMAEFEGEVYLEAIEDLKLFIRRSPTDERADDAQYQVGLAYMELEDYPVAAVEFEILRADYPNSELVDAAYLQEGRCYVEQVPPVHLDQAVTQRAVRHFEQFLRERPNSARRADAEAELLILRTHLDRKRLRAVEIYVRIGKWTAAQSTLQALLEDRPDSELRPDMLLLQSRIARKLDEPTLSRQALTELISRYPDHELASQAQRLLEESGEQLR